MNWARTLVPLIGTLRSHTHPTIFTRITHQIRHNPITIDSLVWRRQFATSLSKHSTTPTPSVVPKPNNSSAVNVLPLKKRSVKKKPINGAEQNSAAGQLNVVAYATADEYDLDRLRRSLRKEGLYQLHELTQPAEGHHHSDYHHIDDDADHLYVSARIQLGAEPREIFFFREGSVVLWNCSELECSNVLAQLKHCELDGGYDRRLVDDERDRVAYTYVDQRARLAGGVFQVSRGAEAALEKYTFSNALSLSVKLGIWEATLDRYVDSMAYVTADLRRGAKISMSRAEVLRKTGELFALRHQINLNSDLLDTPDFYWDREQLEGLYVSTCGYFDVQRRTKVMNEKLNHCIELADLVASNLNDIHHVRLEWMIIILIMVEVAFEMIHLAHTFL